MTVIRRHWENASILHVAMSKNWYNLASFIHRVQMKIIGAIRPTSAHTASDAAQENWKPAEDVGNYDQGRSGVSLLTADFRLRTMEKGQSESL